MLYITEYIVLFSFSLSSRLSFNPGIRLNNLDKSSRS
jgi:hypothetical protein